MTQQYTPNLGETPADDARRDAVHVAVAPVVAGERLHPGARVSLINGRAHLAACTEPVGLVDPYLTELVPEGQRFWLFLFPGSVTSLRHVWTHPLFSVMGP